MARTLFSVNFFESGLLIGVALVCIFRKSRRPSALQGLLLKPCLYHYRQLKRHLNTTTPSRTTCSRTVRYLCLKNERHFRCQCALRDFCSVSQDTVLRNFFEGRKLQRLCIALQHKFSRLPVQKALLNKLQKKKTCYDCCQWKRLLKYNLREKLAVIDS